MHCTHTVNFTVIECECCKGYQYHFVESIVYTSTYTFILSLLTIIKVDSA